MTEQRFDILVQDKVAKTIKTELTAIGTSAKTTHGFIRALKAEMAGMAGAAGGMAGTASATTRALREEASAANAARAAMASQRTEAEALTRALQAQARAARDLASARRAGAGAGSGAGTGGGQAYGPPAPGPRPMPSAAPVPANTAATISAATRTMGAFKDQTKLSAQEMFQLYANTNDFLVQISSGQSPLTAFIQQGAQISQLPMQSGRSWKQFGSAVSESLGIVKRTGDAALDAAAAQASAAAMAVASANAQAAANVRAAETEVALATAQQEAAITANEQAAASLRLTAANEALAASNGEAAVTARALAAAQGKAAGANEAAGLSSVRSLSGLAKGGLVAIAVMATLGLGIAAMNKQINDGTSVKELTKGLGLSAKEMRKMKDELKVTFGDTFKAIFQTAGKAIWDNIGGTVMSVWETMKGWLKSAWDMTKSTVNGIIGAFVGGYRAIVKTWAMFPAALGDVFVQAINKAIQGINWLVSKSIEGLNWLADQANKLLPAFAQLGHLNQQAISQVENQWAGAASKVADIWRTEVGAAMSVDYLGQAYKAINDQAILNARERIRALAESKGYLDPKAPKKGADGWDRAGEWTKANQALDEQIVMLSLYGDELERAQQLEQISAKFREHNVPLTATETQILNDKIKLLQEQRRVQEQMTSIDEAVNGAGRRYESQLEALNRLLKEGKINQEQYNSQLRLATRAFDDATDPLAAMNRELMRNRELLGSWGDTLDTKQFIQQMEQAADAMGQSIYKQGPPTVGQDGEIVATGHSKRLTPQAQSMLDEHNAQRKQSQQDQYFESIDPRQQYQDPSNDSYVLDHYKELYENIAKLREDDVISEAEAAERKRNLDRAYLDARLEATSGMLGQLSQLQNSKNKELAALGKAAAIAQATIDGYRAVQAALVGPPGPPWSFAIAGVTAAMTAANVARIAGIGFEQGGYTGNMGTKQVAGAVHGQEYVFDAAATKRIGVPALDAMRRGSSLSEAGNDNGGGRRGNIRIVQGPGVYAEAVERSDGDIEIIAERVARRVAPSAVAEDIHRSPNSRTSTALKTNYGVTRNR